MISFGSPILPRVSNRKDFICKCYWRLLHAKRMLMHWAKPTFTIHLADLPVIPDSLTGVGGRMWPTDSVICQPAFNIQQQKQNGCSWTWYHSVSCGTRSLWWGFWKKMWTWLFYMFFKNEYLLNSSMALMIWEVRLLVALLVRRQGKDQVNTAHIIAPTCVVKFFV